MQWQVYVFPHAVTTHAHEPLESLDGVDREERSTLHRALVGVTVGLLLAACITTLFWCCFY